MPDHAAAFDHLIHWVHDLDAGIASYGAAGLPARAALTMSGFRNAAWGVDDERYVELAAVDDWEAVATSPYARSLEILKPAIDGLDGPGLLTFAVDVPDAHALADRLRAAGREVDSLEVHFEEQGVGFVEVFVRDAPAYFPFFITYSPPRAELGRMRAEYREQEGIALEDAPELVALLVRTAVPEDDARRLADFIGCPVDGTTVALPGAEVRFDHGTPEGLYGIVVRGLDTGGPIEIDGMTVVVEQ